MGVNSSNFSQYYIQDMLITSTQYAKDHIYNFQEASGHIGAHLLLFEFK